jgi:hypothetical protein
MLRVFPCCKSKSRKLREPATVSTREKPLEKAPEEADSKVFCESIYLLPDMKKQSDQLITKMFGSVGVLRERITHFAIASPCGVWNPFISTAVAVPLG